MRNILAMDIDFFLVTKISTQIHAHEIYKKNAVFYVDSYFISRSSVSYSTLSIITEVNFFNIRNKNINK